MTSGMRLAVCAPGTPGENASAKTDTDDMAADASPARATGAARAGTHSEQTRPTHRQAAATTPLAAPQAAATTPLAAPQAAARRHPHATTAARPHPHLTTGGRTGTTRQRPRPHPIAATGGPAGPARHS
ncbi:hypothetical protein GCM10010166_56190 [Couchioplanes caeruleus subsp. azureus]|nr:hypothetical protein GCM10010166_56190 [Couchioplanes caeruleus subsp. azureus]